jgi:hypothetical protein
MRPTMRAKRAVLMLDARQQKRGRNGSPIGAATGPLPKLIRHNAVFHLQCTRAAHARRA